MRRRETLVIVDIWTTQLRRAITGRLGRFSRNVLENVGLAQTWMKRADRNYEPSIRNSSGMESNDAAILGDIGEVETETAIAAKPSREFFLIWGDQITLIRRAPIRSRHQIVPGTAQSGVFCQNFTLPGPMSPSSFSTHPAHSHPPHVL